MRPSIRHARRSTFRVGAALVLVTGAAWAATEMNALFSVQGLSLNGRLGVCVASAGDVNGDGVADFIAGCPTGDYALVISGADGSTIHTLTGNSAGDQFGASVAGAGDVDGDGYADVIVGAPQFKGGLGAASVFSGNGGSRICDFYGDNQGDLLGSSVGSCGDADGDGLSDVIAGAPKAVNQNQKGSPQTGMIKVAGGNSGNVVLALYGDYNGDDFGVSVCNVGDMDQDGVDDFAVGADYGDDGSGGQPGYARIANVYGSTLLTAYGTAGGDSFGASVAPMGDVNGDKVPDFVVGAPYGANAKGAQLGYASVVSGQDGSTLLSGSGSGQGDLLGTSVAGGRDLDGDGVADFVAGGPAMLNDAGVATGAVRLFSGADGSELDTVTGLAEGDAFGAGVATIDDLNADGVPDIVVGIPGDDTAGSDAGSAAVLGGKAVHGPTGGLLVNDGATATGSTTVTLQIAWTAGDAEVTEMRIRNAGGDFGAWIPVSSTAQWTLPATDGARMVEVQFRDEAGLESTAAGDAIVLDTTKPTGTIAVSNGVAWLRSTSATLGFTYSDGTGTGVTQLRIRNGTTGAFGPWQTAATSVQWTLEQGGGAKQVQVEFKDAVGNVSATFTAATAIDPSAPTGSMAIAGGAAVTRDPTVSLTLTALDTGGSGIADVRLRNAGAAVWGAWTPYTPSRTYDLDSTNGLQGVEAQYRDVAGNESEVCADDIFFDNGKPVVDVFALANPAIYFDPSDTLAFTLAAHDNTGGAGLQAVRTSWDGGATWTPWTAIDDGVPYVPARPALAGAATARVVVRDKAFNESVVSAPVALYFLDTDPPSAGSGAKISGAMTDMNDLDVFGVDLVAGDSLSAAIKAKTGVKKQPFTLAVDLIGPDGQKLVLGRFPGTAKTPGIKGFVALETGHYKIVLRHADGAGAPNGTYGLAVGVKAAKANTAGKGSSATSFSFDAAEGSTFSAALSGPGITGVTLTGPDGTVAAAVKTKGAKVTVSPVSLSAGTGSYTLSYTAAGPVTFTWKAAKPKGVKLAE